jgi:O-antigen ligase
VTPPRSVSALTSSIGRALFLAGIFLMITGDWPRSTLLADRWAVPLPFLAWPWLYLTLLATSVVVLLAGGALLVARPTAAAGLHTPLALLTAAFLLSVACSRVLPLSEWAFGSVLAVVGFSLAVAGIVEDETCMAGLSIVIAAAAVFLAIRVILWRVDEGLTLPAYHVRNNAWLGKIQLSWVLNLVAPLLLARYFAGRGVAPLLYGGAWLLTGTAVYLLFSRAGIFAFPLTTLSLCALNPRYWRRWGPLLAGSLGLAFALIATSSTMASTLIDFVSHPKLDGSVIVRRDVFRQSVRMIVDHPLVGVGLGTYDDVTQSLYGPIPEPHFFRNGWHAHNTALHILAETGAVGLLAWCYLWFTVVRFLLRQWRKADVGGRLNSSAVLCVLLGFGALSMTEAVTAARLHASLRMNLTLALLVVYGIRLAARTRSAPTTDPAAR